MANYTPEQIGHVMDYTTKLIQFSWTGSALLLTAQAWLIAKLYHQSRTYKRWHAPTLISCGLTIASLISLFRWFELIVRESLKEKVDFLSSDLDFWRTAYSWSTYSGVVFFALGFLIWARMKSTTTEQPKKVEQE